MRSVSLPAALLLCALAASPAFASDPSVEVLLDLQVRSTDPAQVKQTAEVIRHRLDELGLDDTEVSVKGDRISVRAGDVDDLAQLRRVILSNAQVSLQFVRFPTGGAAAASRDEILAGLHGQLPANLEILGGERRQGETRSTVYYAVERQPVVTGDDFASVRPGISQFAQPMINFRLHPDAATSFAKATGDNVGSSLAIVINGQVVSTPRIMSRISEEGILEGGFTEEEVQELVVELRSGPLPAALTVLHEHKLTPSHGTLKRRGMLLLGCGTIFLILTATFIVYLVNRRTPRGARRPPAQG